MVPKARGSRMILLHELVSYADDYLEAARFQDYCPNGLQVEGRAEVRRLVTGVSACQALLEAAVSAQADAVLVHHGYFWRGEDPRVQGMKRRRLAYLLDNELSLLAYHLPLDAHPECGNNAQFGRLLGLKTAGHFGDGPGEGIALHGLLPEAISEAALADKLAAALGRECPYISGGRSEISRVGWCTGAAQGLIEQAAALGLDAYLSGEISEQTVHVAREYGIAYFAAGHHATERFGVAALGEHLAAHFGLEHRFIDVDNPV